MPHLYQEDIMGHNMEAPITAPSPIGDQGKACTSVLSGARGPGFKY